jgi:hypothetical protein
MSLTSAGLNNGGLSTNFQVQYETSLYTSLPTAQQASVKANLIANANFLLSVVEASFTTTTGWFNTPSGKFGTGNRQVVNLNKTGGGSNSGYGNPINIDGQGQNSGSSAGPIVAMVWMNEWSEVLMSIAGNWNAGDSSGEGLSQYSGIELFQAGHYNYYGSAVEQWLTGNPIFNGSNVSVTPARSDWVNQTFTGSGSVHGDGDPGSFGCALAFIFYLNTQLSFSINQIIAAYSSNLANAYHTLTGDPGDPFPFFLNLIASVYPASQPVNIPGPVTDNPFPMAEVLFVGQKATFGKDEAQDIISNQGGLVSGAFWLQIQGFSKQSFNALGIQVSAFTGSFFNLPGVKISANPEGPQYESGVNDLTPQIILIPFDITLSNPFPGQFPASGSTTYGLSVALNIGGTQVTGSPASTQFELLAGADPYFTNMDLKQDNQPYLSQDLRVFTGTPAQSAFPFPGGPAFTTDSVAGAYSYIQALLKYLNSTASFTNPNGTDPFTLLPNQSGEGQTDSSVTPFTVDLSGGIFNIKLDNNYNFALARVRLSGTSGVTGEATNVRVFFRLFATQSNDTDYDPNGTYAYTPDAQNLPGSPKVGVGNTTIPFFATGNLSSNTDYNSGGPNIQTLEIPTGQKSIWWYFGCFLNVYDPNNLINGQQVQALLPGTHQCLVAQIAFDDAPIPPGSSPLSWDQLAQRNLQITLSDNPGPAATHRIPQTFDCRPSKAIASVPPDELMIDWGDIPSGSVASLYWPQVNAADVINLANQLYSTNPLAASDTHTIKIKVTGGISYIPIPTGGGENFAGLFTVDLPPSAVHAGQVFNILVRRLSSKSYQAPPPPPPIQTPAATHSLPGIQSVAKADRRGRGKAKAESPSKAVAALPETAAVAPPGLISWRYVVGAFQVQIPVTTGDKILPSEENTLAILKWRFGQMSPSNRWYPVLERYLEYISARVDGLGGDSQSILPSPNGVPVASRPEKEQKCEFTGKVVEVIYDCFGDFVGFVLSDCCSTHAFMAREREIGEVVLRACKEKLLLSVYFDRGCHDKICKLVVRGC